MKTPIRNTPLRIEMMRAALIEAPQRYEDLAKIAGLKKPVATRWIKTLRAGVLPEIHIERWALDSRGRLFVPMFRWGVKQDAPRPGPQRTAVDRMRDMRARRKGVLS